MAFWPTRRDFSLTENAARDLGILAKHSNDLAKLIELAKKEEYDFAAPELIQNISKASSIDHSTASSVFNSLENLRAIAEDAGGAERAFRRISMAIEDATLRQQLEAAKSNIIEAINAYDPDNPVSIAFKAQKLTYLREKLFHEAEIITDVRPVFDAEGEHILEMVVTHSLVLTYWSDGRFHQIHMAIDASDVLSIRKATERAIVKAKALKSALTKEWKTQVVRDET